jgi:hypothetical protein
MDSEKLKKELQKIKNKIIELRGSNLNPCTEESPIQCTCNNFDTIIDCIEEQQNEILTFYNNQKETNA